MACPVCGGECIRDAPALLAGLADRFSPCQDCTGRLLDKRRPPADLSYLLPCTCGRRFIDEVFAHIYAVMVEEGNLPRTAPLLAVGVPLLDPATVLRRAPFLPARSLILLSQHVTDHSAERLVREVPEVKGVILDRQVVPGAVDPTLDLPADHHRLLAGCDVGASVVPTPAGPLVLYRQHSLMHIEVPRPGSPKVRAVASRCRTGDDRLFVDACCGPGTLGLAAALFGAPAVVMNDAWYAAAFWAGSNLQVNRAMLGLSSVSSEVDLAELAETPIRRDPLLVAEGTGDLHQVSVYQGDLLRLHQVIGPRPVLAVLDLFHKEDLYQTRQILSEWNAHVRGEIFIP
ncbi:hypothetical protein [Methanosphaerula palustris]|uniref:Methyltransferase n=1 Tax=Methanosphaerula palustris (strain ATCC BAA-1556 / DSM 19958 / E1-9c) TaxID=521011 RepID=B8GF53_METPE|nr:hypothetical protein [Methanosphaerula palustris]ACL17859.1 conserved hypothetical protein [Methanosphaerula palustris E1-9c]